MNSQDERDLSRFGYAQELFRDMGGFSNFAISFSSISILTGAVTLYGYGLGMGGPREMAFGWPLATLFTLALAVSMAELCSAYPTSGAMYHWTSALGNAGCGWFVASMNIIGLIAAQAGINYSCAQFILPFLRIPVSSKNVFLMFMFTLIVHGLLNHYGVKLVARLNDVSVAVHIAGVALIIAGIFFLAPLQPVSFLLTPAAHPTFAAPVAWLFLLGLLQAQWTYTGFDASAHMAEETGNARRSAPWGIVLSVAVSGIVGYALLIALTLAIHSAPGRIGRERRARKRDPRRHRHLAVFSRSEDGQYARCPCIHGDVVLRLVDYHFGFADPVCLGARRRDDMAAFLQPRQPEARNARSRYLGHCSRKRGCYGVVGCSPGRDLAQHCSALCGVYHPRHSRTQSAPLRTAHLGKERRMERGPLGNTSERPCNRLYLHYLRRSCYASE